MRGGGAYVLLQPASRGSDFIVTNASGKVLQLEEEMKSLINQCDTLSSNNKVLSNKVEQPEQQQDT